MNKISNLNIDLYLLIGQYSTLNSCSPVYEVEIRYGVDIRYYHLNCFYTIVWGCQVIKCFNTSMNNNGFN